MYVSVHLFIYVSWGICMCIGVCMYIIDHVIYKRTSRYVVECVYVCWDWWCMHAYSCNIHIVFLRDCSMIIRIYNINHVIYKCVLRYGCVYVFICMSVYIYLYISVYVCVIVCMCLSWGCIHICSCDIYIVFMHDYSMIICIYIIKYVTFKCASKYVLVCM